MFYRFIISMLLLCCYVGGYAQINNELIKKTFESYRNTVIAKNGNKAVEYIDSRTVAYYNKILAIAKNADSTEVEALPVMDKLNVFTIRQYIAKSDLAGLDGAGFFKLAVNRNLMNSDGMKGFSLGAITISGNSAKAKVIVNGKETPLYFNFYKENGMWKFDLSALSSMIGSELSKMAKASGITDTQYILEMLESKTGKRLGSEIWKKMN